MSLSRKNSRGITVDGVCYRWSFSAPYDPKTDRHRLNLTVQQAQGRGAKIIATGQCPSVEYLIEPVVVITPVTVATMIQEAVQNGWDAGGIHDCTIDSLEERVPHHWVRPFGDSDHQASS